MIMVPPEIYKLLYIYIPGDTLIKLNSHGKMEFEDHGKSHGQIAEFWLIQPAGTLRTKTNTFHVHYFKNRINSSVMKIELN